MRVNSLTSIAVIKSECKPSDLHKCEGSYKTSNHFHKHYINIHSQQIKANFSLYTIPKNLEF